ncbi:hypothetical protein U9M48_034964 [Paspalum notatum var. saurae]|uniref:Reverse transcriptase domain-containing protein n=1 Tax=Paspalum notatum var. saurae TaxID=547442 RepID=A0AAQ3UA82_PASNO
MEEKVTALLMKRSKILTDKNSPDEEDHSKFRAKFVKNLEEEDIAEFRDLFSLGGEGDGGAGPLAHWPSWGPIEHVVLLNCVILDWNVCGLNNVARRSVVRDLVRDSSSTIVCLQETKLQAVDGLIVTETLGAAFEQNFAVLPADGTRGGILLAVHCDFFKIVSFVCFANAITTKIQSNCTPSCWWITVVYGPQEDNLKLAFLNELWQLRSIVGDEWRLIGDFNLIVNAEDKSNDNINMRLMGAFRSALNDLELKELPLNGRRFTWTNRPVFSQDDKNRLALSHFRALLGNPPSRSSTLNWDLIGLNSLDDDLIEAPFEEEEVQAAINKLHAEKAPGPDGFIGLFFHVVWPIVKGDVMLAFNYFHQLHDQHFKLLNSAHICLLPKSAAASSFSDFRPISLSHSVAKIFSKVLASGLAPHLDSLVSRSQSAFIRKRSIHDNFLFTQNLIRDLKRAKSPTLFLKLDIAKAFDSVRWDYLLEVVQHMGFGSRWRAWISILLRTASSAVMINGVRGNTFQHGRGLRQGDPLSPLLFILAIDPLHRLFTLATEEGHLSPVGHRSARLRVSLYADDAAIFINPIEEEVTAVQRILAAFSEASGLSTNLNKCAVYPICCESLDVVDIMQSFPCQVKDFPCKYLGLPLSCGALRRVDFQPVLDKLAAKLSAWKGKLVDKARRLTLVNSVLSSIPVHFLTIFPLKKWVIKKIDKIRRSFLWRGSDIAHGGHCLVKWTKAARPKILGGLGILDLERFSRALRLRWLWFQWTDPLRPWVGTTPPCDSTDAALFKASTEVTIGIGRLASFCHDSWLMGKAPMDVAPSLYPLAWRKNKKVHEELVDLNWTRGLWRMDTEQQLTEYLELWELLEGVQLSDQPDRIRWKWTADGVYTSKSAYLAQFRGSICSFKANVVWKVWEAVSSWTNNLVSPPSANCFNLEEWWASSLINNPKEQHKTISGILMYVAWNVWKERNRRIFEGKSSTVSVVFSLAKDEMALRKAAIAGSRSSLDLRSGRSGGGDATAGAPDEAIFIKAKPG